MLIFWNDSHLVFVPGKETIYIFKDIPLFIRNEELFRFACPVGKESLCGFVQLWHRFSENRALSNPIVIHPNLLLLCVDTVVRLLKSSRVDKPLEPLFCQVEIHKTLPIKRQLGRVILPADYGIRLKNFDNGDVFSDQLLNRSIHKYNYGKSVFGRLINTVSR